MPPDQFLTATHFLPVADGVEFRTVASYPGYAFGNDGSVWSSMVSGSRSGNGQWRRIKPFTSKHKKWVYEAVKIRGENEAKRRNRYVHQLILEAFVGPKPEGQECCHDDGNGLNNRLCNIRWDTPNGNTQDKKRHGRVACGARCPQAKLTEINVGRLKAMRFAGASWAEVSKRFGVHERTARRANAGVTWKQVA